MSLAFLRHTFSKGMQTLVVPILQYLHVYARFEIALQRGTRGTMLFVKFLREGGECSQCRAVTAAQFSEWPQGNIVPETATLSKER